MGNIYNKHIDVYCECDHQERVYYIGYIYMAVAFGVYLIWRVIDQKREPNYPTAFQSL